MSNFRPKTYELAEAVMDANKKWRDAVETWLFDVQNAESMERLSKAEDVVDAARERFKEIVGIDYEEYTAIREIVI